MSKPGASKPYMSKCSKRNHRRNKLVSQALFQYFFWVFRVLVCGHGVLSSIWASITRKAIEGMSWLWKHHFNQVFGYSECWYVGMEGHGDFSFVWANVVRETIEDKALFWNTFLYQIFGYPTCSGPELSSPIWAIVVRKITKEES